MPLWEIQGLLLIIVLAFAFDFINGFHDTANAIAASIYTGALRPQTAVMLASVMNFVGALCFTGVAQTIGQSIACPFQMEKGMAVVIATLLASVVWNLITWFYGIPSSSSHALIGALAGAALVSAGFQAVNFKGFAKIIEVLLVSPLLACAAGFLIMLLLGTINKGAYSPKSIQRFKTFQVLAASLQAFSHGTNDAQKTMGIITFALVSGGFQSSMEIALWVKIFAATAIAMGTAVGGWRIIHTVGTQITLIDPPGGFSADLCSASIIFSATLLKFPVSTTHVLSSSIIGVGLSRGIREVNWNTVSKLLITWIVTIPATFFIAGLLYILLHLFLP